VKSAPTSPKRVASIDIGTNTILLLITGFGRGKIKPLFEEETIVRLGEGVRERKRLFQEAMERGLETLARYMARCRQMGVEKTYAVGTSALREAKNAATFLNRVKKELGLEIEIISGEEEARLSYLAVTKDLKETKKLTLVVDVGGGSTEFIVGKGDRILKWVSLPLGSVRLTEEFLLSDPIENKEENRMLRKTERFLSGIPHPRSSFSMVAVGGTATALASVEMGLKSFIPERIHHFVLRKEALGKQLSLFRSKTIEERRKIQGLSPARADVIFAGGMILYRTMEELECPDVMVSCHGVRYGVLYKKIMDDGLGISD